ncbi:MAG TPA: mechanosensitive ion channel domain-containing protein [Clostridia bacterium]|nr:mechanosensitive ion channel domain-containing protein [Clostridia bacterium]
MNINLIGFYLRQVVFAVIILVVGLWAIKFIVNLIKKAMEKKGVDKAIISFSSNLLSMLLKVVLLISIAGTFGFQTTTLVGILSALAFAVGLALQGSLSNFAAGVMILLFKPFKIGDYVEAAGHDGTVQEIEIFNTILATVDNKKIIIPNSQVYSSSITNYSHYDKRRVDLEIGVDYDSDIKQVKKSLENICNNHELVHKDPAPFVRLGTLADSSINFKIRVWTDTPNYWGVYFDLTETIKENFDNENIEFPYPHVTITKKSQA